MKTEGRELYVYTVSHFEKDIRRISPDCVAPLPEVRKVVKKAMGKYLNDYCEIGAKIEDVFSQEDFEEVSRKIFNEL